MNHDHLWKDVTKVLQGMLNAELFNRWFTPIKPIEVNNGTLVLGVANEFYQIWLQDNFSPLIRDAISQATNQSMDVKFVVSQGQNYPKSSSLKKNQNKPLLVRKLSDVHLNHRYTFETFVVGSNNNFSHAAALAVAQSPAKAYNPLFMYGGVGLGKTHLMQAIGHLVSNNSPHSKISYITCEQFTNEFIQAIQHSSLIKFRKKYRQADILLIDDIQFLSSKERMQEEFFHTFNTLFDAHKQIVLSSDRPAAEISNLENRLVSRFEWGLVTEFQPPDLETRIAILRKKAAVVDFKIPDDVLVYIAEKIRTNIRRLEGALIRVASYSSLTGKTISIDSVESLLRDSFHEESKASLSVETIQKKVSQHFDIRLADMTSRRRPQNVAFPRQVAMFLSRNLTDFSLSDIGERFGGRDHGTVMHACKTIQTRVASDQQLRQTISHLERSLRY